MSRKPNTEMRCKIVSTAVSLFHQYGFRGVSMDDVAVKAGIKKANLFHYYPSKEELGLAALCEGSSCQQKDWERLESFKDPVEAMEAMFDDAIKAMRKDNCARGCFLGNLAQEISGYGEKMRRKIAECFNCWAGNLAQYFKARKREGYFRKDFDPEATAEAIISAYEGAMLQCKAMGGVKPLENSKKFVTLYLKGYRG